MCCFIFWRQMSKLIHSLFFLNISKTLKYCHNHCYLIKTAIIDKAAGSETFWVQNVHKIQKDKLI